MGFFDGQPGVDMQEGGGVAPGSGMVYYPTLLVGLGGTGTEVLLRVKKHLQEQLPGRDSLHRFLFIDTDRRSYPPRPGYPKIEESERCLIGVQRVSTLLAYPDQHAWIWERFPKDQLGEDFIRQLAAGKGAGQVRALGALALALDYDRVQRAITAAFTDLIEIGRLKRQVLAERGAEIGEHVLIYLTGSLNGGTGSGCLVDVALIAKRVCAERSPKVAGMFAVPNAAFDEAVAQDQYQVKRIRANAYAALKELQLVLDSDEPGRPDTIVFRYGTDTVHRLVKSERLFDLTYLVDDANSLGRLSDVEELYELMARSILLDVGSSFGARAGSFNANNVVLNGVEPCPKTGSKRLFGTVATSSLVYPAHRVSRYCTFRQIEEAVHDVLLGGVPSLAEVETSVTSFLQQNKLNDRGNSNQILESLLTDGRSNEVLSSGALGLDPSWGQKLSPKQFATRIDQQWQQFTTTELPRVVSVVKANLERRLGRHEEPPADLLKGLVEEYALSVASEHNANSVARYLQSLGQAAAKMRDELQTELDRWVSQGRQTFVSDFDQRRDELALVKFAAIRKRDELLKASLIHLLNDLIDQELGNAARPGAIDLLDKLGQAVQRERDRWTELTGDLKRLEEMARVARSRLETHTTSPMSRFSVEQEVTRPGYEARYYESQQLTAKDGIATIAGEFESRRELYRWMLGAGDAGRDRGAVIGERFAQAIHGVVAPPLLQTNIVDFVADNSDEVSGSLGAKLSLTFDLCQPFWDVEPVQAGMGFPEVLGVCVAHLSDEKGRLQAPPLVQEWIDANGPEDDSAKYQTIPSDVPYEITLGRRTYGARAFYQRAAAGWREIYKVEEKKAHMRKFLMETHAAFSTAPDLFPEDTRPFDLFALGMALGFIVTRGDWYYFGLDKTAERIRVLYTTQAKTARGLPQQGSALGPLTFELKDRTKLSQSRRIAQGRRAATEALREHPSWIDLLGDAVDEYHAAIGNAAFLDQLRRYLAEVLEPSSSGDDIFFSEAQAIRSQMARVGR